MIRRVSVVAGALAAAVLLSACGSSTPKPTTPDALRGKSGAAIIAHSEAAMLAQGSVYAINTVTYGNLYGTTTEHSGLTESVQHQSGSSGGGVVMLVGKDLYVEGDANYLAGTFASGTNFSKYANIPLYVPTSDPNYAHITSELLLPNFITSAMPIGPYTVHGITTFNHHRALRVSGVLNSAKNQGAQGTIDVYVSLSKPYLPIGLRGHITHGAESVEGVGTFSNYGKPVHAVPPTHAVNTLTTTLH